MVFSFLDKYRDAGLLILRVGIGVMFVLHGYPKLSRRSGNMGDDWRKHEGSGDRLCSNCLGIHGGIIRMCGWDTVSLWGF